MKRPFSAAGRAAAKEFQRSCSSMAPVGATHLLKEASSLEDHQFHSKLSEDEMSFVSYAAAQPRIFMDFSDLLRVAKVVETEPSGEEWQRFCRHMGREGLVGLSGLSTLCETTPLGFFDMPAMKQLRLVYAKSALQIKRGNEEDLQLLSEQSSTPATLSASPVKTDCNDGVCRVSQVIADVFHSHSLVAELFADSLKEFVTGNVKLAQSLKVVDSERESAADRLDQARPPSPPMSPSLDDAALSPSKYVKITTHDGEHLAISAEILKHYDALQPFCEQFSTLRATYRFMFSHFLRVQEGRRRCVDGLPKCDRKLPTSGVSSVPTLHGPIKIDWSVAKYGVDPKNGELKQYGALGHVNVLQVAQLAATNARVQADIRWRVLSLERTPGQDGPLVPKVDLRLHGFSERRILTIPAACFNCISAIISHAVNGRCSRLVAEWNTLESLRSEPKTEEVTKKLLELERRVVNMYETPIEVIVSQPADSPNVGVRIRDNLGDGLPLALRPYTSHFIFAALAYDYDASLNGGGVACIGEDAENISIVHADGAAITGSIKGSPISNANSFHKKFQSFRGTVRGTDNKMYPKNVHDFSWSESTIRVPYADCVMRNMLGGYMNVSHVERGPVTYFLHFPTDIERAAASTERKVVGISPRSKQRADEGL